MLHLYRYIYLLKAVAHWNYRKFFFSSKSKKMTQISFAEFLMELLENRREDTNGKNSHSREVHNIRCLSDYTE